MIKFSRGYQLESITSVMNASNKHFQVHKDLYPHMDDIQFYLINLCWHVYPSYVQTFTFPIVKVLIIFLGV